MVVSGLQKGLGTNTGNIIFFLACVASEIKSAMCCICHNISIF